MRISVEQLEFKEALKKNSAVVIVQHMPAQFTAALAGELATRSAIAVHEARAGDYIESGVALIAPGDFHFTVEPTGRVALSRGPEVNGCRPSVDVTFESLARTFGPSVTGVVLTGMGRDGAQGMKAIRGAGGRTISQDEASCVVYGMPKAAVDLGVVDRVLPLDAIPDALLE